MNFELNQLVECFTTSSFHVQKVYRYQVEPGRQGSQKTHPFPGLLFPLGGKAQFGFNGTSYITDTQKVIHGGAEMNLDKKVLGDTELSYILILYDMKQSPGSSIALPDVHFDLAVGDSPRLKGLLNRLWKISHVPDPITAFQKETLFYCILEEMFICADNQVFKSDKSKFTNISGYIQENYKDEITVSELAELYEMNTNQLYYLFTKYAGIGPGEYLITYRLNRAKELLATTDSKIYEVANNVGYADSLYFSRIFKKRFGVSPGEMRKDFRNHC